MAIDTSLQCAIEDKRISVLETEVKNVKECLHDISRDLARNTAVTLHIKERIDKQNGAIPHMVESIKEISNNQEKIFSKITSEEIAAVAYKEKTKILWWILATIATGIIGYIFKSTIG